MNTLTRRGFGGAVTAAAALSAVSANASSAEADQFRSLYTEEWAWRLAQFPDDEDPERAIAPYLPDASMGAQAARLAKWRDVQTKLAAIDRSRLSPDEQVDYLVYKHQIDSLEASQAFRDYEAPFNSDSSVWGDLTGLCYRPFHREADYRAYTAQMRQQPRYFGEQIALMRQGLARGFTPPRVTLTGRDGSATSIAAAKTPQDTVYWKPFAEMPASIPSAVAAELKRDGEAAIRDAVIPAHATLAAFLRETYIPNARTTLAAEALPNGRDYYLSKIREFTTVDLTPEEIHALGLSEVDAIRARMEAVMREVGFAGSRAAFLANLRTDPRFYVSTPQALLDRAAWIAKTFDGKASTWFGRLPRARFAIRPVPADQAPFYTAGRGGRGVYLLNTYDLPSRPLYALTALTLHESAPGHAFQIPLAEENEGLPEFRRKGYISAYGEGWALYCERLGEEMGMYETPYDRFGMLSYQMWRACRLVVDTGVHAKGWSRDQALAYLRDNTALSEREVGTEVDRYISWPGQALSYYLGQRGILAARKKAQVALGPRFDIRAFHDAVLQLGSVPLPAVSARIDRFIAEGGIGPYPLTI